MLPSERDIAVIQERHKDLLREAEHARLIRIARSSQPNRWQAAGRVLHQIGLAVVRLSARMVGVLFPFLSHIDRLDVDKRRARDIIHCDLEQVRPQRK